MGQDVQYVLGEKSREKGLCIKLFLEYFTNEKKKKNFQEASQKELLGVHLPKTLKELEIRAAKNGSGWLVGSEVSLISNSLQ